MRTRTRIECVHEWANERERAREQTNEQANQPANTLRVQVIHVSSLYDSKWKMIFIWKIRSESSSVQNKASYIQFLFKKSRTLDSFGLVWMTAKIESQRMIATILRINKRMELGWSKQGLCWECRRELFQFCTGWKTIAQRRQGLTWATIGIAASICESESILDHAFQVVLVGWKVSSNSF